MSEVLFHTVIIALAIIAAVRGFYKGLSGQVPDILGFAFGLVSARILAPAVEEGLRNALPFISGSEASAFTYSLLASASVFCAVFLIFKFITSIIGNALSMFGTGILNSLFGAAFCILKYMLFVSIAFNLILCVSPRSKLMDYARADDGNAVECVMLLGPSLLGCGDCLDLAHLLQLRDARKISHNILKEPYVNNNGGLATGRTAALPVILIENA